MSVLSGLEFNKEHKEPFYKFLHDCMIHFTFRYKVGLNIDTITFNPTENCAGGLHFTNYENIPYWVSKFGTKVGRVTIPDDAQVYILGNKIKADKLVLSDIIDIQDMKEWNNPQFCLDIVKYNALMLSRIKSQTPELCLCAVKQNGCTLQFVLVQTPEICLEAVKQDWRALQYVRIQTETICVHAVMHNKNAHMYISDENLRLKISQYL